MKDRRPIVAWSFLLIVLSTGCSHDSGITTKNVEALIAREVSANADKSQVLAFLEAHRLAHSGIVEFPQGYLEDPEFDTELSGAKLRGKVGRVKRYAVAKIPNIKSGLLETHDLFIKFYFDKDDRLVEYVVRSVGRGL